MKVTNPGDRAILAAIDGETVDDRKWYEIPAGESIEVDDYVVASTLVEHGAVANADEIQAARILWAEANRRTNSKTASASASEGAIIAHQQATVDVATGGVSGGDVTPLTGNALRSAVSAANAAGAGIDVKSSAEDRRAALAVFQQSQGASSAPDVEYLVDENGNVELDGDGQPYPLSALARDEGGDVVRDDDGRPVLASVEDTGTGGSDPSTDGQGDGGSSG